MIDLILSIHNESTDIDTILRGSVTVDEFYSCECEEAITYYKILYPRCMHCKHRHDECRDAYLEDVITILKDQHDIQPDQIKFTVLL